MSDNTIALSSKNDAVSAAWNVYIPSAFALIQSVIAVSRCELYELEYPVIASYYILVSEN
jgi:hypothetical protein